MSVGIQDRDFKAANSILEPYGPVLQRLIAEAVATERERCAQIAEKLGDQQDWSPHYKNAAKRIAGLIRRS